MQMKVLLVDYYGICDETGKPIGHSPKALKEYSDLIKKNFSVSAAVSPCLIGGLKEEYEELIALKYNIYADGNKTLLGRIIDKFKLFYNINETLKYSDYDIVWFYRTDFFLFFYFFLRKKRNQPKLVALVYQEEFITGRLSKILSYLYRKGAGKFHGLIYTQKGMAGFHGNTLYIPDYYYDEKKYGKYRNIPKKEMAVCLGTMTPYKKLEELIDAFNENGMQLEIKGYFYEKERFQKLLQRKTDNIIIEDVVLSEEEYYRLLAEAKYSILPYDMKQYGSRTSGVLQESLFLNTIPVAPRALLEENGIAGIGYEEIEEMKRLDLFSEDVMISYSELLSEYDRKQIQEKVICFLQEVNKKT